MKKNTLLIVLFIELVAFGIFIERNTLRPGVHQKETEQIPLYSGNVQGLNDTDGLDISEDLYFSDGQRIYQVFISDDKCIRLSYTADAGMSWNETIVSDMVSKDGSVYYSYFSSNGLTWTLD